MENHTAKHFVLQLGSLASLYVSLSFLLVLLFGVINLVFPDATDTYWNVNSDVTSVRLGIAITLVFFPTYLILTRVVNQARRQDPDGTYLGLTKWLIYLSLLVGGAVLLVDLVIVIMTFLEGEITQRFILKALAVLVVVGTAFFYYLRDAKGYWLTHESQSKTVGIGVAIVVIAVLINGFMFIETPQEARERELDEQQITDLREIQWQVQNYLAINEELPEHKGELPTNSRTFDAPEDRADYEYRKTGNGFELCADFAYASREDEYPAARPVMPTDADSLTIVNPEDWEHEAGWVCFERVVK